MGDTYVTGPELAALLHMKTQTIRKWRLTGEGPTYIRIGGIRGRVIYKLVDVEEWLSHRKFHSTSQESAADALRRTT